MPEPTSHPAPAICSFCRSPLGTEDEMVQCGDCSTVYHEDCWTENGGCAAYGCASVPAVEKRAAIEVPMSFWGQENKPCPSCNREILAAAVRCRHCGATFSSAQPEDPDAFNSRLALEEQLPRARRMAVWIFVLSVLPCTAPFGGVWGLIWYPGHKREIKSLPAIYPVLCIIGIVVGLGQTAALVALALLYNVTKH